MSTEQLSEIETPAERQEAPAQQTDPAVEAKARETGWVPQDEYKGDPAKWKPAEKWKSPDQLYDNVRKKLDKKTKEFDDFKRETADTFKRTERMNAIAIKQAKQDIVDRYEKQKREAVKTGDEDAYEKADAAKDKALQKLDAEVEDAKPKAAEKNHPYTPEEVEAVEDWKDANTWFESNDEMTKYANRKFGRIRDTQPDLSMDEALDELDKAVQQKFPDEFAGKRKGASRVEGGSRDMDGGGRRGGAFASLPAEARAQADRFIKEDGLFLEKGETAEKNISQARDRYAAKYLEANRK